MSTTSSLDDILGQAATARREARDAPIDRRVSWLSAVADALDAAAGDLIPVARRETHLPEARLTGELARTSFQARLFARRLSEGLLQDARIDHADPDWPMGPRPDIRRTLVPIGVVLVFAASNFPFAFSVAGGDSVSALAAGCPVVVKAHPGHPELSRLTADVVRRALAEAGAPSGLFGLIEGYEAGVQAVQDPRVRAVGFTGSVRGGRALFDLASSRPDPIPFYGELGSTNPVLITPDGWARRADEITTGFAQSFTLGSGQFCTKPGVVFAPDVDGLIARLPAPLTVGPLLNEAIEQGFAATFEQLSTRDDVGLGWRGEDGDLAPALLRTSAKAVLAAPELVETECFGPAALLVGYEDLDDVRAIVTGMGGSLTASVHGATEIDDVGAEFVGLFTEHAGRILWNEWPTGVTVSDAQQHGGPWPATTAPTTTSVGIAAISRFLRPVAFQNMPERALPVELRDAPHGVRLVDGRPEIPEQSHSL